MATRVTDCCRYEEPKFVQVPALAEGTDGQVLPLSVVLCLIRSAVVPPVGSVG